MDPERIGIHGLSWGGYIVALALARDSDIFKIGFDMAGTHAAPIAEIAGWESPVRLVQGDDDRNVAFRHGVDLASALMSRRPYVELEQRVFPNEVHDLYLTYEDLVDTYVPGAYFVLDHLQADEPATSVDVSGTVEPTLARPVPTAHRRERRAAQRRLPQDPHAHTIHAGAMTPGSTIPALRARAGR